MTEGEIDLRDKLDDYHLRGITARDFVGDDPREIEVDVYSGRPYRVEFRRDSVDSGFHWTKTVFPPREGNPFDIDSDGNVVITQSKLLATAAAVQQLHEHDFPVVSHGVIHLLNEVHSAGGFDD